MAPSMMILVSRRIKNHLHFSSNFFASSGFFLLPAKNSWKTSFIKNLLANKSMYMPSECKWLMLSSSFALVFWILNFYLHVLTVYPLTGDHTDLSLLKSMVTVIGYLHFKYQLYPSPLMRMNVNSNGKAYTQTDTYCHLLLGWPYDLPLQSELYYKPLVIHIFSRGHQSRYIHETLFSQLRDPQIGFNPAQ